MVLRMKNKAWKGIGNVKAGSNIFGGPGRTSQRRWLLSKNLMDMGELAVPL